MLICVSVFRLPALSSLSTRFHPTPSLRSVTVRLFYALFGSVTASNSVTAVQGLTFDSGARLILRSAQFLLKPQTSHLQTYFSLFLLLINAHVHDQRPVHGQT